MSLYTVKGETLTAIAAAIREKTGSSEAMTLGDMPSKVGAVHDAGRKAEYDGFWDAFQQNGNRTTYNRGFAGRGWNDKSFRPKYHIRPRDYSTAYSMFSQSDIADLIGCLAEQGVVLDTSGATDQFDDMFANCTLLTAVPALDLSKGTSAAHLFVNCGKLKTVEKLIVNPNLTFSNAFHGCGELENIVFEGEIGTSSLNVSASPKLTYDSLMSILAALKDFSATGITRAVTLGSTNLAKLTDGEKKIATDKGWTLA